MVKTIIVERLITDSDIKDLEGTWIDESFIKFPIINEDTDIYKKDGDNIVLLAKFRKNVIPEELIQLGWECYKDLAKPSRGRGASAGPIDKNSQYWKKRNINKTNKWSTSYINKDGKQSRMKVNNQVASNPIGYYEASNNFSKLPCRLTHFTRTNFEKYSKGLPFIQKIDELFKELVPDKHQLQLERSNKQPLFKIPNTSFSTITINRNFRTALHLDANDFKGGFGNLTVIEYGYYSGGYTVFPQYGIGINIRSHDFCAMDVHEWHSNTPFYETEEDKLKNSKLPYMFTDNHEVGTAGIYEKYTRLSFVCYLREKIINCETNDIDNRFLTKSGHSKIDTGIHECIYDCGFTGTYNDVEKHELTCKHKPN